MTWRLTSIKRIAFLLIVAGMLIILTEESAMFKVCLFSPVQGKVVLNGQPVVGAVIERTCKWNWKNEKERDQTVTDEKGEFSLLGIYSWMCIVQLVPHEPVIHQHIVIQHKGTTYNAWYHVKHEYGEFAELDNAKASGTLPDLNGKPLNLLCELTIEPKNHGGVWGYGGLAELRQI